jgi:L-threonate 2-dehydrogenase
MPTRRRSIVTYGFGKAFSLQRNIAMKVGVIGLGIMGGAMAANLARCGFKVVGYDPAASAIARAKVAGIDTASSAEGVVKHADLVLTSLASLAAVRETASVILQHASSPRIVIETSTLPLSEKLAFGDALAAGGHFVDRRGL